MSNIVEMKYVLVTGGVVSGLGKGVTASSIGVLLKNCGFRTTCIKIGEAEVEIQSLSRSETRHTAKNNSDAASMPDASIHPLTLIM